MLEKAVRFIQGIIGGGRKELVRTFDTSTPCQPTIQFLVPMNGVWASVGEHAATPSRVFDYYLDAETSDEEVLAAAILVYGDNRPWNTTEHSEGLMHVEC